MPSPAMKSAFPAAATMTPMTKAMTAWARRAYRGKFALQPG
jgi:hypothetical protein